jgi:hypothetical protein
MGLSPAKPGAKSTIDRITSRVSSTNVNCLLHIGDISILKALELYGMHL